MFIFDKTTLPPSPETIDILYVCIVKEVSLKGRLDWGKHVRIVML